MREIYLDNAATTKPWPEVSRLVVECMGDSFANASSSHRRGLSGARRIAEATEQVCGLIGSGIWNVVFTSGGTESDSLAVFGVSPRGKRTGIVTSTVEHAAIEDSCKRAKANGQSVAVVSAGPRGVIDPIELMEAVTESTILVSLTHVANEMGTIQPVNRIAKMVKKVAPRALVHVDGVQGVAQLETLDYAKEVDMVSISSHKIHGPQGVGALVVRPGISLKNIICGGDQQDKVRPGTLNLPGIAGFGLAASIYREKRGDGVRKMKAATDRFVGRVTNDSVRLLGDSSSRAPGIAVLAVEGVKSQVLLHALEMRGVLASAGSACHAARKEPPRCLVDAGLRQTEGAVRFSLSLETTQEEMDVAADAFADAVDAVRAGRVGEV